MGARVHRSPPNRGPYLDVRAQPFGGPAPGRPHLSSPGTSSPPCWSPTTARAGCPTPSPASLGQDRPVQNVIAADTGSADDSARILDRGPRRRPGPAHGPPHGLRRGRRGVRPHRRRAHTGRPAVPQAPQRLGPRQPHLARRRVRRCPSCRTANPCSGCGCCTTTARPRPSALARTAARRRRRPADIAVVGPKLLGWYDRRQLLEAGVTIAHSGRRWTGVERREQDQGQHDQVRPVLSVSTAGMLIRRDVFEELGGFDRRLPLMRDDVDLCWRAHAAGHRVLVAPEAVVRHAEAASRERRPVDCVGRGGGASPHRVDKAGAVYTLLDQLPAAGSLPWVLLRLVLGTLLRTLAYLVGKVPGQALDEVAGLFGTLLRPGRILAAPPPARPAGRRPTRPAAPLPAARRDDACHRRTGRQQLRRPLRARTVLRRPARRRRVRAGRRRRGLPRGRAVRPAQADRAQARPGAVRRAAARLAHRLPRAARRRRPGRRRAAARARGRVRTCGAATPTAGTPSAPAAPAPLRRTSPSSRWPGHRCCSAAPASR